MSFVPPPGAHGPSPEDAVQVGAPDASGRSFDPAPPVGGWRFRPFPLHPSFGWAILWCIAMLLLTQVPGGALAVAYIFVTVVLFPGAFDANQMGDLGGVMMNPHVQVGIGIGLGSAHLLLILLSLVVLRVVVGRDWMRQVAVRPPSMFHAGLIVAMTPAFIILAQGVFFLLRDKLGLPSLMDPKKMEGAGDLMQIITAWPVTIGVLLIGLMPALSEELWCRAFLGRGLVGIHGYVAGVLMTSFLFGLIHIDPCQGGMAAVLGVVIHYVYLTTRSLLAPMLLHFLNNATEVVLARSTVAQQALEPAGQSVPLFLTAGLVLAAVGLALYQSRARLEAKNGEAPWRPPFPGVACPPPGGTTVVVPGTPSAAVLLMVLASLAAFGAVAWSTVTGGL